MKRLTTNFYVLVLMAMIMFAGFSTVCYGEPGAPSELPPKDPAGFSYSGASTADTITMVVKVIFFLIVIIGLFFVIIKFLAKKNTFLSGRSIRSLGGVPLGQNKSIQVVEIGRALYVVGVGENVQLMEKIADAEEVAYITEMLAPGGALGGAGFQSVRGWLSSFRKNNEPDVDESDITSSFQQIFQNKMQHLSDRKKMVEELWTDDKNKDRLNDKQ